MMDALNEIKVSGSKDCVVFKNPAPLEELMDLNHCANFVHSGLYEIKYMEYLGKRIVSLCYDTESG